jgi:hypothetical protein
MPNDTQAAHHQRGAPPHPPRSSPSLRKRCTVCSPEHSGMRRTTKQTASPIPSPNSAAECPSNPPRLSILETAFGMNGQRHGMQSEPAGSAERWGQAHDLSSVTCTCRLARTSSALATPLLLLRGLHCRSSAPMRSSKHTKSSVRRISSTKHRKRKTTKVASADSAILYARAEWVERSAFAFRDRVRLAGAGRAYCVYSKFTTVAVS